MSAESGFLNIAKESQFMITRPRRIEYPNSEETGPQLEDMVATAPSIPPFANVLDALNETLWQFHQHRNEVLLWLHHECGTSEDGSSSDDSLDSDEREQILLPKDLEREEEAILNNFVYLWRRHNAVGSDWQLVFGNDSSSPDLGSSTGLDFAFLYNPEYFTPEYADQAKDFHALSTFASAAIDNNNDN